MSLFRADQAQNLKHMHKHLKYNHSFKPNHKKTLYEFIKQNS
jgi:hypothetical protein